MTTMSVARIAETLQHDFRSAASQLRHATASKVPLLSDGRVVGNKSSRLPMPWLGEQKTMIPVELSVESVNKEA